MIAAREERRREAEELSPFSQRLDELLRDVERRVTRLRAHGETAQRAAGVVARALIAESAEDAA
ncbi:hypothetical protein DB32_003213 [Sandaracinus amylolyticus]|uniref:Uncharacterized protein n=1 Tax=Sandaracinus amylolyticus TaxID=927083 RepID=A0A0F6SEZ7_9BACT|nr:hypothetical protein DB32_003213 [Sandaracinus amylolyticus]